MSIHIRNILKIFESTHPSQHTQWHNLALSIIRLHISENIHNKNII